MIDVPTFLFTDVQGSRAHERWSPSEAARALQTQDRLVRASVAARGGEVFEHTGDGLYATFPLVGAAALAAVDAQREIVRQAWTGMGPVRVRMAIHAVTDGAPTSELEIRRCGHLLSIGHGGQVLLSGPAAQALLEAMPDGLGVWLLGLRRRHPLSRPEQVYQLLHADLPATFPPLTSLWPRRWRRWRDRATAILWREAPEEIHAVDDRRARPATDAGQ
jgi:class 3 adenylate cyclase